MNLDKDKISISIDALDSFKEQFNSKEAQEALEILDELADMIIFHQRTRDNAEAMMKPYII